MRRLRVEDPVSRAAIWSPRVAATALAAAAIAAFLVRSGRVELDAGAAALAGAFSLAGLALLLSGIGFAAIWSEGRRGFAAALGGLLLAGLVLAPPALVAARAASRPAMADVATDLADEPTFSVSREASVARDGWTPPAPPSGLRERQRAADPTLAPLPIERPEDAAFEILLESARALGWTVVDAAAPGESAGAGRLDATARTLVLRLPIEIAARVRPYGEGAKIDVRAVRRAPIEDVDGAPEAVRALLAEVEARARGL